MDFSRHPIRIFDPAEDVRVTERRLPHWSQAGTLSFVTWRTWDSMPRSVLDRWISERGAWLRDRSINPQSRDWRSAIDALPASERREFQELISDRWQACLDECHGACVLKRPELARIVADSLGHFDGQRYWLTDYVVMPNHVHIICAFQDDDSMLAQCENWKHFTARKINQALDRRGRFWQQDGYDRLVRSEQDFDGLRRYIADNPTKARLLPGQYIGYSKLM